MLTLNLPEAVNLLNKREKKAKFTESIDLEVILGSSKKHKSYSLTDVVLLPETPLNSAVAISNVPLTTKYKTYQHEAVNNKKIWLGKSLLKKVEKSWLQDNCKIYGTGDITAIMLTEDFNDLLTNQLPEQIINNLMRLIVWRKDKQNTISCSIGRETYDLKHLETNLSAVLKSINKKKPEGFKGQFIRKVYLTTTMHHQAYELNLKEMKNS